MLAGGLAGWGKQRGGDLGWAAPLGSDPVHALASRKQELSAHSLSFEKRKRIKALWPCLLQKDTRARGQLAGGSLPTPGPCPAASYCGATGEDSVSATERLNFFDSSSPQQLNHAMCSEELAGKALNGGSDS